MTDQENKGSIQKTYVVEKLIDRRSLQGHTEYLVKWKDYPESLSTWEPRDVLMETMAFVIENFDAMADKQENGSMKSNTHKRLSKKSGKRAVKDLPSKVKSKKNQPRLSPQSIQEKSQPKQLLFKKEEEVESAPSIPRPVLKESPNNVYQTKLLEKLKQNSEKANSDFSRFSRTDTVQPSQTVEILRITHISSLKKNMLEVRFNSSVVLISVEEVRQSHPRELCEFYEKTFKIVP